MKSNITQATFHSDDSALSVYPPLLATLLRTRGIKTKDEAEIFLHPSYEQGIHDPYLMKDMEKAVVRIFEATEAKEKITIYADYDCDGIPGAVVLHDFFKKIGYENFEVYIPDRHDEGYGLHADAVADCIARGTKLLITVDLGITAVEEVAQAQSSGVDVIITDHHLPHETLPHAYAILNPKQPGDNYLYDMLCGAAVAFKLVQALIQKYGEYWNIQKGWEKWLLDMVGLATLSDMVPLKGENRVFAHFGLEVLRKSRRPGLIELLLLLAIDQRRLTEDDIGFMISPRLNAASRMDSPMRAFELLTTTDHENAHRLAKHLGSINDTRKQLVAHIMKETKKVLSKREERGVIVIGNPSWHIGVLGLVANKLVEEYQCPAFVWGANEAGEIKGSCRSNGTINIVALMSLAGDSFLAFGGHALAGGFSVERDTIHFLEEKLNTLYQTAPKADTKSDDTSVDIYSSISELTTDTWIAVSQCAPFGCENPKPLFSFNNCLIEKIKIFGKEKNHLELILAEKDTRISAIAFFKNEQSFSRSFAVGDSITLLGTLEYSYFRSRGTLRIRIVDIV